MILTLPISAEPLVLGAAPLATYIDDEGEPARLNQLISTAFERMGLALTLRVERQAFLGSDLIAGKINGEFAFSTLNDEKSGFLYSDSYLPIYLHAVAKTPDVKLMRLIPHLRRERVAVENQFANTPTLRVTKEVKWSRNPTTYDAFRQLADGRAAYLLTTRLLADEFNLLLRADNEEQVFLSPEPLWTAHFKLSLNKQSDNAAIVIKAFNKAIAGMQTDGTYNRILGIPWLLKDVDGDGAADYITSAQVMHPPLEQAMNTAYPLDGSPVSDQSKFFLDGEAVLNMQSLSNQLKEGVTGERPSLLDQDVYRQILRRW